jgi:hypothetical protein
MIGLAVLEYVASKIEGLEVEENCFYEDLPIDPMTGQMTNYGVFVTTESAPMSRTSDETQFLTFYVGIGEGAKDADGNDIAEKYETDRLIDAIRKVIKHSLENADELCELSIEDTDLTYRDVRLEMATSKQRDMTMTNGAIVKNIMAKVIYKD